MANCDPEARTRAADDLRTIAHDVALGICSSRQAAQRSTFNIWTTFCDSLSMDPTLAAYPDPVPAIQLFAHRYRAGELSPSRTPVRGRTVGDAVRAIGQNWPAWDSRTPASLRLGSWTSASRGNWPNTAKTMIRRTGSNPYHSQSCNKQCRMHVTKTHHSTTPSQTSSSSASSSSFGQGNTPPQNRRTHRHFASRTPNCSATPDLWRTQRLAKALSNQTSSASCLPNKKTESEGRWSGWVHPETEPSVPSHPYKTAYSTYSDWGPRRLPLYKLTT